MLNPLLQGNQTNGMMQMLKSFKQNPVQTIQQMIMNTPNMKEINEWIKEYGSPEQAFRHKAAEMGKDPDELINLLK